MRIYIVTKGKVPHMKIIAVPKDVKSLQSVLDKENDDPKLKIWIRFHGVIPKTKGKR